MFGIGRQTNINIEMVVGTEGGISDLYLARTVAKCTSSCGWFLETVNNQHARRARVDCISNIISEFPSLRNCSWSADLAPLQAA
jgi:hypothetical protein